ncbi:MULTISPECIES: DUF4342 domain-containing protein [Pseudoclavibacter]|uniref:DUF4342 domain-containing protein n=1 Tax=Pseudoclavibacter terrae TaxID=1530195 RepID=A0A7J5B2D7_9MICO|nr:MULTISPECIES: DUF4342 domain-containing protein [Pseudoclavibacter]KAB1638190.1 DUF4342 domain-containing protein [Pseudoclavibacter terrae]PPG40583.1 hypothetical protein C5C17_07240 [Pseudoclavibacter sp. RFBA6]
MTEKKNGYEEFKVSGENLLGKVKELIHEGNVRRVFIKNDDGTTLLEIPLTAGLAVTVVAAALAPVLVAVGAIAALVTQVTVGVDRREPGSASDADESPVGADGVPRSDVAAPAPSAQATDPDLGPTTS